MKKLIVALLLLVFVLTPTTLPIAWASANPGDRVITLGADLSTADKQKILAEFKQTSNDKIITVTAADEVRYLPGSSLSGKEYSSSLITIKNKGEGIVVTKSKEITQVSTDMYQNALVTAGIHDANVSVTAPMPVSGTAALTGIFKAFETATGQPLNEARKQAAGQEIVATSQLGQSIGNPQKASEFVQQLKEKMQQLHPQTDADYQKIIEQVAQQMGIPLTSEQVQGLVDLLKKLNALNIDWSSVANQLKSATQAIGQFANDNPQKVNAIVDFFQQIFTAIQQLLQKIFS